MLVVAVLVAKNVNKWGLFIKTDNTLKVVRKVFNISGIGFCVLAIIMLGIAFSLSSNNNEFYDSAQTTNGIVVFTRQSPSRTVIEYEVDGKTYNEGLSIYNSSVNSGDEVTVYYSKDNPKEIKVKELSDIFSLVFYIIGGIFLFVGIVTVIVINVIYSNSMKKDKMQI